MVFNIGDKVRLKDDHPDSQWVVIMIYHDLNKVGILHSNDFGTQMQIVDPLMLTRIDPLYELKQAIREVLLSEEFLSAFAKAFVNTPIPSTIQYVSDLSKGLVKAWTCEDGKAKQVYPEQPQLPDGWRWLEVGERIRKGDRYFKNHQWHSYELWVGVKIAPSDRPSIRRNKFEVSEKVVECVNNRIGVVKDIEAIGSGKNFLCHVEMQDTKCMVMFSPHQLAPYIEETT